MSETPGKLPREDGRPAEERDSARHQWPSYHHVLAALLLEDAADVPEEVDGLSSIMSTFQHELDSPSSESDPFADESGGVEDGDVLQRLLEASDDELGIPCGRPEAAVAAAEEEEAAEECGVGLWEVDDESANYYALIHSELFM